MCILLMGGFDAVFRGQFPIGELEFDNLGLDWVIGSHQQGNIQTSDLLKTVTVLFRS